MAIIETVENVEPFFPGELPSHEKFTEEFSQKVNIINTNHVIINDALELLLQGISGGAEQAKMPFALAAAPDGWTRDVSFTTDHLLRVTDGVTVPPGVSPTATGGAEGGDWTITGTTTVAASGHTHNMNDHSHSISHSHAGGSHTHTGANHNHTLPSHSHAIFSSGGGFSSFNIPNQGVTKVGLVVQAVRQHRHTVVAHDHGGTTNPNTGTNATSSHTTDAANATSSTASPSQSDGNNSVSSNTGGHNHTVSHAGNFRPKYLNMLICSKD